MVSSSSSSPAETFFTKVANDVLEASEKLSSQLEDGFASIFNAAAEGGGAGRRDPSSGGGAPFGDGLDDDDLDDDNFGLDDLDAHSPLQGMADNVINDIMHGQVGPQTPREHFDAFRHAITWSEPFIVGLVSFQVAMMFLSVYVCRRDMPLWVRLSVMIFIGAVVKSSEFLNGYGSTNWSAFCTQNYFDARGIFVSIMVCAPLLLDSLVMLLLFLREASQLLVQVKRAEIKKRQQQRTEQSSSKEPSATAAATSSTKRRSKKEQ